MFNIYKKKSLLLKAPQRKCSSPFTTHTHFHCSLPFTTRASKKCIPFSFFFYRFSSKNIKVKVRMYVCIVHTTNDENLMSCSRKKIVCVYLPDGSFVACHASHNKHVYMYICLLTLCLLFI